MSTTQLDKNTQNLLKDLENNDQLEDVIVQNMIEDFMNLSDEDNKIFNLIKDTYKDLKVLNYGNLLYIQDNLSYDAVPHISELLGIYEEIFSNKDSTSCIVLNQTKYYILYNDGFVTIADNGYNNKVFVYKIKTLVVILRVENKNKCGFYASKLLKVLKAIKYI